MREEVRDWLKLIGKTALVIVGGILAVAASVEIAVGGAWIVAHPTLAESLARSPLVVLAVGLALALPPMWFAFRDALHEARKGYGPPER